MFKDIFIEGNGGILGAVARVGLPVVLSAVFVWFLIVVVISKIDAMQYTATSNAAAITRLQETMNSAQTQMQSFVVLMTQFQERQAAVALQTCLGVNPGAEGTRACVQAASK